MSFTYRIDVDGVQIYYPITGFVDRQSQFNAIQPVYRYFANEGQGRQATVTVTLPLDDGVFLEQTITSTSAGRDTLRLATVERVVDAEGNQLSQEIADQYGVENGDRDTREWPIDVLETLGTPRCFLAGTPISMWDGTTKPIEEIVADDIVTSYDKRGRLVPGRVTRTFQNTSKHILDLFGLMVTPGHATFCAEGRFAGRHVPIIDILRSDGALMKQDGTIIRAATGCEVGSEGDQLIQCVVGEKLENGQVSAREKGQIRAASRIILSDGSDVALIDLIKKVGARITEEGLIKANAEGMPMPFHWRFSDALPKAEDYILARSGVTLKEIYEEADWEAIGPQLPDPKTITSIQRLETDINMLS